MDGFNYPVKRHGPAFRPAVARAPQTAVPLIPSPVPKAAPAPNFLRAILSETTAILANLSRPIRWLAKPVTARLGAKPVAAIGLAILALLIYGFLYQAHPKTPDYLVNGNLVKTPQQQQAAQQQIMDLAAKVGKLISLPPAEVPAVASITDTSKLAGQPFFAKAQNGDKVLIYSQAQKAYLYRPSTNKIINVSAVDLGSGAKAITTNPTGKTP